MASPKLTRRRLLSGGAALAGYAALGPSAAAQLTTLGAGPGAGLGGGPVSGSPGFPAEPTRTVLTAS